MLAIACIVGRGAPRNTTWEVMKADVAPRVAGLDPSMHLDKIVQY